jgi:hypothetical protein
VLKEATFVSKVKLTLEEIANGVEKSKKVKRKVQAPGVSTKHVLQWSRASDARYEYHFRQNAIQLLHVQLVVVQVKF